MSPSTVPASASTACPRCQQPLIDPQGLGWCKACGYCRSLAEVETQAVKTPKPARAAPTSMNIQPPTAPAPAFRIPVWVIVLIVGVCIIAGAIAACGRYMALSDLHRAVLTTTLIVSGLLVMFIGQFIVLLRIAPEEASLSFKDAVVPLRLYGFAFKRLPSAQAMMHSGAWGVTLIACGLMFIGGLQHWFTYLPNSKQKNQTPASHNGRR